MELKKYIQSKNYRMHQISEYTGISYKIILNNLSGKSEMNLDTFIMICEYIAHKEDKSTPMAMAQLLNYVPAFTNALKRDLKKERGNK